MAHDETRYPFAKGLRILGIIMLAWALLPINPSGIYIFLRWILLGIFAYLALFAHEQHQAHWSLIFSVGAGLHNPLVPAALGRPLWSIVNIISIGFILRSMFILKAGAKSHKAGQGGQNV